LQFGGENFNGLLLFVLGFSLVFMGNKKRTPFTDAWEGKAKERKLSHTLLTGTKKRNLNILQSYGIYWIKL
jgi:hypothetical protein